MALQGSGVTSSSNGSSSSSSSSSMHPLDHLFKNSSPATTAQLQRLLSRLAAAADISVFADKCSRLKLHMDWWLGPRTAEEVITSEEVLLLVAAALANGLRQLLRLLLLQQARQAVPQAALLCLQQLQKLLAAAKLSLTTSMMHDISVGLAANMTSSGEWFLLIQQCFCSQACVHTLNPTPWFVIHCDIQYPLIPTPILKRLRNTA
jgi:hypothetical protein